MIIESPKCRSPSKFSTPEGGLSDEEDYTPIQSRKNINMVIFDSLSSTSEAKPRHERDKLEFACLQKRHTLFHQLDRTQWLALLTVPLSYTYENEKEFKNSNRFFTTGRTKSSKRWKNNFHRLKPLVWWICVQKLFGLSMQDTQHFCHNLARSSNWLTNILQP